MIIGNVKHSHTENLVKLNYFIVNCLDDTHNKAAVHVSKVNIIKQKKKRFGKLESSFKVRVK